jgi:DNA invertase Pin-like site-specific DNA recombinase
MRGHRRLGANSDRPARNQLMESARRRQFELVLVLRLGRWGRSVADCVDTLRLSTSYGVAWLATTSQGLSTQESSVMGRLTVSIMSAFSELEKEMIVERVVVGVKKARVAGKHCGAPGTSFAGTGSSN